MTRDHRRLAAIVSADVVGYSLLMGRDDSATLAGLKAHRQELIDPKIAEYGGRIVKTTGDGLLLEFPSVVDAVRCAVDVQRGMAERNASVPAERRIEFRIGINVGDIIIDGDDIYGDGVNVAARLQTLAEPGGICVSRVVRDQVTDKLSFAFEDLGAQEVKNIVRPVEVYRVDLGSEALPTGKGHRRWLRSALSRRWRWVYGAGVIALGIAGVLVSAVPRLWAPVVNPSPPAMSVVVAPLVAAPGDVQAVGLAEAFTRDLLSSLGRVNGSAGRLLVVASQGDPASKNMEPRELGRRFNARYVLQGNVVRGGNGDTVNLQLIDAATRAQLWSEREKLQDFYFSSQPSVSLRSLVRRLRTAVTGAEIRRVLAQPVSERSAQDLVLRAIALREKDSSRDSIRKAHELVDKALRLDPNWIPGLLERVNLDDAEYFLDPQARAHLTREMDEDSALAVALDPADPMVWQMRSSVLLYLGRWDAALDANATSIKLDPDEATFVNGRAYVMNSMGRPAEALQLTDRALAMDTTEYNFLDAAINACISYQLLGQAERAVAMCEKGVANGRNWIVRVRLVAAYANNEDKANAAAVKAEVLRTVPGFTIAQARAADQPLHPEYAKLAEKYYYEGLRKAGFAEQ